MIVAEAVCHVACLLLFLLPRHSPELAQAVIDSGALDSLVTCLEEFDPGVKEAATWCLGYIVGHNTELAQQVVDAGEDAGRCKCNSTKQVCDDQHHGSVAGVWLNLGGCADTARKPADSAHIVLV